MAGAGTTKELQTYYAMDNKPLLGTSYYRLKQTDYDGSHAYSDVVRVYMSNLVDPVAILYPNPVLPGNRECYVKIMGAYFDQVFIRVTHSSGKVMFAGLVPINAEAEIPLHTLVPALTGGVYILNLAASDFRDVKRLVIAD